MEPSACSHPGDEGPGSSSCGALGPGTCRPEAPSVPSKALCLPRETRVSGCSMPLELLRDVPEPACPHLLVPKISSHCLCLPPSPDQTDAPLSTSLAAGELGPWNASALSGYRGNRCERVGCCLGPPSQRTTSPGAWAPGPGTLALRLASWEPVTKAALQESPLALVPVPV